MLRCPCAWHILWTNTYCWGTQDSAAKAKAAEEPAPTEDKDGAAAVSVGGRKDAKPTEALTAAAAAKASSFDAPEGTAAEAKPHGETAAAGESVPDLNETVAMDSIDAKVRSNALCLYCVYVCLRKM